MQTQVCSGDSSTEDMSPIQRFVVHSPLVAMKSLGRRSLVILEKRTAGEIVGTYGEHGRPGLVTVAVKKELFLIWKRDLEQRAELLTAVMPSTSNVHTLAVPWGRRKRTEEASL